MNDIVTILNDEAQWNIDVFSSLVKTLLIKDGNQGSIQLVKHQEIILVLDSLTPCNKWSNPNKQ